jgi:hypothetical protein
MPGQPDQETKTLDTRGMQVVIHKFSVFRDSRTQLFMALYMDFPGPAVAKLGTDRLLDIMANSVAADAHGSVEEKHPTTLGTVPGVEVTVRVPNTGVIISRVFVSGQRCYQVSAAMPDSRASSPEVRQFLDSFQLLP